MNPRFPASRETQLELAVPLRGDAVSSYRLSPRPLTHDEQQARAQAMKLAHRRLQERARGEVWEDDE